MKNSVLTTKTAMKPGAKMPEDYNARQYALQTAVQIFGEQNFEIDALLKVAYMLYNFLTVEDLHEV